MADNECGCAATSDPVHSLQSYNSKIHSSINKVIVFFFHIHFRELSRICWAFLILVIFCTVDLWQLLWGACTSYSKQLVPSSWQHTCCTECTAPKSSWRDGRPIRHPEWMSCTGLPWRTRKAVRGVEKLSFDFWTGCRTFPSIFFRWRAWTYILLAYQSVMGRESLKTNLKVLKLFYIARIQQWLTGTQEWEFFWLRFGLFYYFIVSYA